jgi:hypothetical protein
MPAEKILYPKYGALNNVEKPFISPRLDLRGGTMPDVYKKMVETIYTPNATLGTGPYKGIVLRVEKPTNPEVGSWLDNFYSAFNGPDKKPIIVQIKARIPELHAMLPIPSVLGDDSKEQNIIEMYPTFIAQANDVITPAIGSLVWLDYGNKTNFTDPIYIKPVNNTPVPSAGGVDGPKETFGNCTGKFSSNPPSGDVLSGKNKPLSHEGLPLQPRMSQNEISKEYIFMKGLRYSQSKLKKWEKSIKNKDIPGKSWIGIVTNNGLEDFEHSAGKRNTLIYAPNATNFMSPIELIYFFHGKGEFGDNYDFEKRFPLSIKSLIESKRNFVLVIPELPWSIDCKNKNREAWSGNDNFGDFHKEIVSLLKENYSNKVSITFISIIGHSEGGRAIKNAAMRGLDVLKPNRIVFADASYPGYAEISWDSYIKNDPKIEFNLLVQESGTTFTRAKDLYDKISSNKNVLFQVMKGKTHKQIGDLALTFVSPNLQESQDKQDMDSLEKSTPQSEEDLDLLVEPMAPEDIPEQKNKVIKQPESKLPLPINANVSPFAINKIQSGKKTSAVIKEAVPFEEARVRVSDYKSLVGTENILIPYPCSVSGRKALVHKLVAKRLDAMNSAWLSENPGKQPILINNGFRPQKKMSEEEFNRRLDDKYKGTGGVSEGRKWNAYYSPHETGMAVDMGSNNLSPDPPTNEQQKQTFFYKWLRNNAHKFGFTPYKFEAWHWECRLPRESWSSGEEFTDNLAMRVESPGQGGQIPYPGEPGQNCVMAMGDVTSKTGGVNMTTGLGNIAPGSLAKDKKRTLIEKLSQELGIETSVALAFLEIETGGQASFVKGRVKIKFEPHVFANNDRMKKFGISSDKIPWYDVGQSSKEMKRKWIELGKQEGWSYTENQDHQYKALQYAIAINEEMAYESISPGSFQVMGFNCKMVGYPTAKKMFEAFQASEELQVRSFFTFALKRKGLLQALKDKNYLKAAQLYNGYSTKAPYYASKIEESYNKYRNQGIA